MHSGWLAVGVALVSLIVASQQQQPIVATWSLAALLVALLPIVTRRRSAASALALIAAIWIATPATTALLWFVATCRRRSPLAAAGVLLPIIALTTAPIDSVNPAAFAAVVLIAVLMVAPTRPTTFERMSIGSPVLLAVLLCQLRVAVPALSLPDWAIGAGVMPAAVMLFALAGGRGLNAASMDDVLAAAMAVCGGVIVVAGAAAATVSSVAEPWLIAILSTLATFTALVAMRPRPAEVGFPETLDLIAGQGPRRPIRMGVFSALLLSLITPLPLTNGWSWLHAVAETLQSTRTDPQPGYLLVCLALSGPVVLAPLVLQILISAWVGQSRGGKIRFRAMAWSLAVVALVGPIAATYWLRRS